MMHIIFAIFTFLFLKSSLLCAENNEKKTVWFLAGHMQDIFGEDYLKPMLQSGYDLTPMHRLREVAIKAGYNLRLADPNASQLMPFSHINSGIPEVAKKRNIETLSMKSDDALQNFEYIIVFEVMPHQIHYLSKYPKEKLILFLWEPPSVMPQNYNFKDHSHFSKVYTWKDDLVDNKKYFKFYYPVLQPMISDIIDFDSKKMCTLIAGNKTSHHSNELYTERHKIIDFFEQNHSDDFDLYGKWWPTSYNTYKGAIDNKIDRLKYYKFCIAYENIKNIPGYVTEKIFNAFQAGCVPIYLGASNISAYIPKNCFIDRNDFKNEADLYVFMKNITKAEYLEYIKNIQKYLASPQAHLFSSDHFVEIVINLIKEHHQLND